ncbi:MAG: hypothetical protein WAS05_00265 [Candidatus Nanopelagicales bacterium]
MSDLDLLEAGQALDAATINRLIALAPGETATKDDLETDFPDPLLGKEVLIADVGVYVRWNGAEWDPLYGGLPNPVNSPVFSSPVINVTATSWANLPVAGGDTNKERVSIDLPFDCWCFVNWGFFSQTTVTSADLRVHFDLFGATTRAENGLATWAEPSISQPGNSQSPVNHPLIKFNAGVTTARLRAYRSAASGTHELRYPTIGISPIRWA